MNTSRITPDNITQLKHDEIFVFGSNLGGRHGGGAARLAMDKFGAVYGVGMGRTGQCYAIATKDEFVADPLSLAEIAYQTVIFFEYAKRHPDLTFLVTEIGCGFAGFVPAQIAPFFHDMPGNVWLPRRFWDIIENRVLWDTKAAHIAESLVNL